MGADSLSTACSELVSFPGNEFIVPYVFILRFRMVIFALTRLSILSKPRSND